MSLFFSISEALGKVFAEDLVPFTKEIARANPARAIGIAFLSITLVIAGYLVHEYYGPRVLAFAVGVFTSIASVGWLTQSAKVTSRLISASSGEKSRSEVEWQLFRNEFLELRERVSQLGAQSSEDLEKSREQLKSTLLAEIGRAGSAALVSQHVSSRKIEQQQVCIENLRDRLTNQIQLLWSFANRNMTIGAFFSVVGIVALFYFLATGPALDNPAADSTTSLAKFFIHFTPRVTFVIFIEIFAFFFLRLYRNAIAEIKYFQNELTNVDLRAMALIAATYSDDNELLRLVIERLSATEKNNVVLKVGETTVDLFREERNLTADKSLTTSLKPIIDALRSKGPQG